MFIRYNETTHIWEYDSSLAKAGSGPWIILPIDYSQIINVPAPEGIWQPYTSIWKTYNSVDGSIGNGTFNSRFAVVGKTVHYSIVLIFGTTTNPGTSFWAFTFPSAYPAANFALSGSAVAYNSVSGLFMCQIIPGEYFFGIQNSIGLLAGVVGGNNSTFLKNDIPFTWTTGNILLISGFYETT